jgi:DeoR/GlpR family transcriptional regulator of sugar metabolism
MLAIERKESIINIIRKERSVRVNELAEMFQVTEETIRRDLDKLDKVGIAKKTYGGAVLLDYVSNDVSFNERLKVNMKEKQSIASFADTIISDGETIFIDMSTTALEFIKNVDESKHITVITNSLTAINELSQMKNIQLITIGGTLNAETMCMEGPMTTKFIQNYYVDKTFFSVKALSKERGIMDSNEHSAEIKRQMIHNANQAILLADYSKFGKTALTKVTDMSDVDILITEFDLDEQWLETLSKSGTMAYRA